MILNVSPENAGQTGWNARITPTLIVLGIIAIAAVLALYFRGQRRRDLQKEILLSREQQIYNAQKTLSALEVKAEMNEKDLLVVGSGSGESIVPVAIAEKAKQLGGKIVHIVGAPREQLVTQPPAVGRRYTVGHQQHNVARLQRFFAVRKPHRAQNPDGQRRIFDHGDPIATAPKRHRRAGSDDTQNIRRLRQSFGVYRWK